MDVDRDNHLLGIEVLRPVGHVEIMHRSAEVFREPALDLFDAGKVDRFFAAASDEARRLRPTSAGLGP